MLPFSEPIIFGALQKRYQRFFMDVRLEDGTTVVAHTANTGSMAGLLAPGNKVMLTKNSDAKRKLAYTAVAIEVDGHWVGVHTHLPNKLVKQALQTGQIPEFSHYQKIQAEVKYGENARSRIDLLLSESTQSKPFLYVEIKNVTMKCGDYACFPDAVSTRAQKHLDDLCFVMKNGHNAALFFIIQRLDCSAFKPADHIDAVYGEKLRKAHEQGLLIRCFATCIDQTGVRIQSTMPCM